MNAHNPDEFAPLSYGAAMIFGLLLILALPTETKPARRAPAPPHSGTPTPSTVAPPVAVLAADAWSDHLGVRATMRP